MTENDILKAFQTDSPKYVYGCYKIKPEGIVVHSTGANNPNLKRYVDLPEVCGVNAYANYFGGPNSNDVVPHAAIGKDKDGRARVVQILPYDLACQCAGKGSKGSYNVYRKEDGSYGGYIQFETAEDGLDDEEYFNEVFDVVAQYCAFLANKYGIKLENIVSHNEAHKRGMASGHVDPENWLPKFGKTMDWLRAKIADYMKGDPGVFYRVQVGAFKERKNAELMLDKLKSDGYEGFIVEADYD